MTVWKFSTATGADDAVRVLSSLSAQERKGFNPQYDLLSPDWDVFDSEGRFLGVVRMPDRFQPVRFLGTDIYGIQRDELDVQYVVKLKLEKSHAT